MKQLKTRAAAKNLMWPVGIVAALLMLAASLAATTSPSEGELKLTILHTNDLHSHDETFIEHGRQIGGMARIAHMIKLLKSKAPDHTLVIDAGDIFQGTPLFTRYQGEVEVNMLNRMGYDIYTIGNHEFDDGPKNLAKQLSVAKFDVISCNMDLSQEPELEKVVKPYTIKTIDGQKIAFVGAITPDLIQMSMGTGKVAIKSPGKDWINPIADEVHKLKAQGIDKIILVTHVGVDRDRQLGEALPDVDAIIGGHSHTRLDKAIIIRHKDGTSTTIVQTGCYGRTLGKLDLTFDGSGKVIDADTRYRLINITPKISQEPEPKAYLDEKVKPLLALRHDIVAQAKGDFDQFFRNHPWDSALGDMVADALAEAGKEYGATIAFENRGGMRARIDPGPITEETVQEILPFDNKVTFATIDGACLMKALQNAVGAGLGGKFLDEHGLKLAYDFDKPIGSRIVFALVEEADGSLKPIDPHAQYKIVINNYSFGGGEGFDFSTATNKEITGDRIAVALDRYLHHHKVVTPQAPSRIVPVTAELLTVTGKGAERTFSVKGVAPRSKLTLIAGSGEGAESVFNSIPAPVESPKIIQTGVKADASGQYTWHLPLSTVTANSKSATSGSANSRSAKTWVCIIAEPPKKTGADFSKTKPLISYPIELD